MKDDNKIGELPQVTDLDRCRINDLPFSSQAKILLGEFPQVSDLITDATFSSKNYHPDESRYKYLRRIDASVHRSFIIKYDEAIYWRDITSHWPRSMQDQRSTIFMSRVTPPWRDSTSYWLGSLQDHPFIILKSSETLFWISHKSVTWIDAGSTIHYS